MKSTFEKNITDSYNKKAIERNLSNVQEWKVKEREFFLNCSEGIWEEDHYTPKRNL